MGVDYTPSVVSVLGCRWLPVWEVLALVECHWYEHVYPGYLGYLELGLNNWMVWKSSAES